MVAKELKVSWNTAQLHLYKLMAEGVVKGRRVGRQNQWIINRERA
jgi:predicted ArsR family transcriptional regulator